MWLFPGRRKRRVVHQSVSFLNPTLISWLCRYPVERSRVVWRLCSSLMVGSDWKPTEVDQLLYESSRVVETTLQPPPSPPKHRQNVKSVCVCSKLNLVSHTNFVPYLSILLCFGRRWTMTKEKPHILDKEG